MTFLKEVFHLPKVMKNSEGNVINPLMCGVRSDSGGWSTSVRSVRDNPAGRCGGRRSDSGVFRHIGKRIAEVRAFTPEISTKNCTKQKMFSAD